MLGDVEVKYLLYADDLVLLAASPEQLQSALDRLITYARRNRLVVNVQKTKCMTFYNGSCPQRDFFFDGQRLENCNSFTYLGIVFTTRLSSSKHVDYIVSKCNSRIGYLFSTLCLQDIPLGVALDVFKTYILPIITYGLPIWLSLIHI